MKVKMCNTPFLYRAFMLMLSDNVYNPHEYKRILNRIQAQEFDVNYMIAEAELRELTKDQLSDLCLGDQDNIGFLVTEETKKVLTELFEEIY